MPDTLVYQDNNSEAFVECTFDVVMDEVRGEFLHVIPEGGHILDALAQYREDGYRTGLVVLATVTCTQLSNPS